jgi:hypothetical protein
VVHCVVPGVTIVAAAVSVTARCSNGGWTTRQNKRMRGRVIEGARERGMEGGGECLCGLNAKYE